MPLIVPVILGGAALAASLVGLKRGHDGLADADAAERRRESALQHHAAAARAQEQALRALHARAERFGRAKLEVIRRTRRPRLQTLEALHHGARIKRVTQLEGIDLAIAPGLGALRQVTGLSETVLAGAAEDEQSPLAGLPGRTRARCALPDGGDDDT